MVDHSANGRVVRKIRESIVPFVVLATLLVFLSWRIVSPMTGPLAWSAMLSYFAYPLYKYLAIKLFKEKHFNVAAALTSLVILFFLVLPMTVLVLFLAKEALKIYSAVIQSGILRSSYADILLKLSALPLIGRAIDWLDLMGGTVIPETIFNGAVNWMTRFVSRMTTETLGNAFKVFYLLMVVSVSSFFFVRDGHKIISVTKDILPLAEPARDDIIYRAAKMLRAVVYGIVFTASVQGVLGGLGWYYVGLPNAVFFGFMMFITGMIPFVGTPVVWIPGAIYLQLSGETFYCILLLLWGFGVVSTIDNFIRPIFIAEGSKIHVLLIFVGILGGLYNWGLLGLFVGPLILSMAVFVLDIYRSVIAERQQLETDTEQRNDAANSTEA